MTGPPIDTLPPSTPTPPVDAGGSSVDVGGTGDGTRSLESAYRPAGVAALWRDLVDVWKIAVPKQHAAVHSVSSSLLEVFR